MRPAQSKNDIVRRAEHMMHIAQNSCARKATNNPITDAQENCVGLGIMAQPPKDVAYRVAQLRLAMGFDQAKGGIAGFARFLGVEENRLGNVERRYSRLAMDLLLLLRRKCHGVSYDWLLEGDPGGLSVRMRADLEKADQLMDGRRNGSKRHP